MKRREYKSNLRINNRSIKKVVIDPHFELKHHGSVSDETILILVEQLNGRVFEPVKRDKSFECYVEDKMKWPSKEDLDRILPELEEAEGSLHLSEEATPLERFRYQLCQRLLKYKMDHKLKQRDLAEQLEIDESVVSKILHHRIERISTDKLITYVQSIEPDIDLRVAN